MNRRKLLAMSGTGIALTLAGCAGETEDDEDREEGSTDDGDDESGDGNGTENGAEDDEQLVELLEHEWYNNGQFDAGVSGRLENVSGEELSYVEVSVYFLDEDGTQIEEGLDNTNDLADGRVWEFDAGYLGDDPERVDTYEIETSVTNY